MAKWAKQFSLISKSKLRNAILVGIVWYILIIIVFMIEGFEMDQKHIVRYLICFLVPFVLIGVAIAHDVKEAKTERGFTKLFAERLESHEKVQDVEILSNLVIHTTFTDGSEIPESYLDNAYRAFLQDTSALSHWVEATVAIHFESDDGYGEPTKILPIIKPRNFLENFARKNVEPYYEPFCADLIVLYVEDREHSMFFTAADKVEDLDVPIAIREIALSNLSKKLPNMRFAREDSVYYLYGDGNYEPSFLLIDHIWEELEFKVDGELVAFIPNRDLLFVTGSRQTETIRKLREKAVECFTTMSHPVSTSALIRSNGKWEEYIIEN